MVISLTIQMSSPELISLLPCPEATAALVPRPCSRDSAEEKAGGRLP